MYEIADKLQNLVPYDPIKGNYKIRLDANESFVSTNPDELSAAVSGAVLNRYPDPYANDLINVYADLYEIDSDLITAGNGSDELISVILSSFFAKGEKILCFYQDFSVYSFFSFLYELDAVLEKKEADLTINIDAVIKKINSENIRGIIFSNPCNPTSLGIEKEDVKRLIESTNALVILDEAYMDFWEEEQSLIKETASYDNLIVLRTCSKALGMAGLRLGLAVSNTKITAKLRAVKCPYNVNALTQCAAAYFLRNKEEMKKRINLCKAAKEELYSGLISMDLPFIEKIYPSVTNFVLVKTDKAKEIFDYLLDNSIAVRFMGDHLRITAGTSEENKALFDALKKFK